MLTTKWTRNGFENVIKEHGKREKKRMGGGKKARRNEKIKI